MIDFFEESDKERSRFEGDWSRSSRRTDLLHGFIENDLKSKKPSVKIEKEKTIKYDNSYSKKHDFFIDDSKVLELKFIEKDFEKNANNYFEGELGRSLIVEKNGKDFYSMTFVRSSACKSDFENTKNRFKKYDYLKNKCVYYYDDDSKKYTLLNGIDYDSFIDKIVN